MSRWFERILIAAAMVLPLILLGAPAWAIALAIAPALWIAHALWPDPARDGQPDRARPPRAQQLALLALIGAIGGAMGLAGLLDSTPGVLIWIVVSGAIIAIWRAVKGRRARPSANAS